MIGWTLGRYFFARYVKITFYFLLGVFVLALMMDFTENAGRLSGIPGYTALGAVAISALRIPFILQQLLPFIALFSAMATLVSLNLKFELVVARSIGVSAWQFLMPVCFGAFLFGLFGILVVNPLSAFGAQQAERIILSWQGDNVQMSKQTSRIPWLTQHTDEGYTTIGAAFAMNSGRTLVDTTFVQYNNDNIIKNWLNAATARLDEGQWVLSDVTRYRAGQKPEKIDELKIATKLRPEFIEERLADPSTIPFYALPEKINIAKSFGYSVNAFDMQLQSLIALPALLIAMTLIAATVSLRFMRFGQSASMILGGVLAGFILYVVSVLVQAFGKAGYVPPFVAAWVPVIIALFFGVSFLLHKEDG